MKISISFPDEVSISSAEITSFKQRFEKMYGQQLNNLKFEEKREHPVLGKLTADVEITGIFKYIVYDAKFVMTVEVAEEHGDKLSGNMFLQWDTHKPNGSEKAFLGEAYLSNEGVWILRQML